VTVHTATASELGENDKAQHIIALRMFFQENRPDNVGRVPELFAKNGHRLWEALEKKYPGRTAKYTAVRQPLL
jgi:hypothetical protein